MDVAIVHEWLGDVEADLDAAWSCSRGARARPERAVYMVQQAAEKLVKAMLVSVDIDPPRTHDIAEVIAELPADTPFRDRLTGLAALTPYATGLRYPSPLEPPPLPSFGTIDAWITEIEALKADFERRLAAQEGAS